MFLQQDDEKIIVESRVRFLSFLGIGRQVENCGFIVHTANDVYIAHVLCCYPSSGAICKTIEAACKVSFLEKSYLILNFYPMSFPFGYRRLLQLRYQKCLDAHGALRGRITNSSSTAQTPTGRSLESLSATLKSVFGSISLGSKKTNKTTGESWMFCLHRRLSLLFIIFFFSFVQWIITVRYEQKNQIGLVFRGWSRGMF